MATAKKSGTSAASVSGTLLSAPFKPGKDGIVYFYFWVKYADKLPTAGLVVLRFLTGAWKDVAINGGKLELFLTPSDVKHS